jgi:hypothetical protein
MGTQSDESRQMHLTLYAEGVSFGSPSLSYRLGLEELWTSLRLLGVSSVSKESSKGLANHEKGVGTRDLRDENMEIEREGGGLLTW